MSPGCAHPVVVERKTNTGNSMPGDAEKIYTLLNREIVIRYISVKFNI